MHISWKSLLLLVTSLATVVDVALGADIRQESEAPNGLLPSDRSILSTTPTNSLLKKQQMSTLSPPQSSRIFTTKLKKRSKGRFSDVRLRDQMRDKLGIKKTIVDDGRLNRMDPEEVAGVVKARIKRINKNRYIPREHIPEDEIELWVQKAVQADAQLRREHPLAYSAKFQEFIFTKASIRDLDQWVQEFREGNVVNDGYWFKSRTGSSSRSH